MTLTAPPRLLLVHAHPDDETICTGGTIARYAAIGVRVTVVTCTLGEEGEVIPAGLRALQADDADQLGGYRVAEMRAACGALGITDHRFLGGIGRWRDSGMVGTEANANPRSFVAGDPMEQADALARIMDDVRPQIVVSYDAHGGYGHPDHIRAHEITGVAAGGQRSVERVFHTVHSEAATRNGVAALAGVPGLPFIMPGDVSELPWVPDERITTAVDIGAHRSAKLSALRAHATQVSVWQNESGLASFALSNGVAQPVVDAEYFVLADGDPDGAEQDLFGGLGRRASSPDAAGARGAR